MECILGCESVNDIVICIRHQVLIAYDMTPSGSDLINLAVFKEFFTVFIIELTNVKKMSFITIIQKDSNYNTYCF